MLRGDTVYINGDGESSRDFCFVDNVVQANIRAALSGPPAPSWLTLNIAVGERTTLIELFHLLRKLLASRGSNASATAPAFRDFRPGDVKHSLANIDKAAQLIGYAPTHTLEEGLDQALDWYVAALGRP